MIEGDFKDWTKPIRACTVLVIRASNQGQKLDLA